MERQPHQPAISIHALLAESDGKPIRSPAAMPYFYPRSPCGERRECGRPARCSLHFYPRSPCGERPKPITSLHTFCNFYPRSPCGERPTIPPRASSVFTFLSTLSLRRATWSGRLAPLVKEISIHALLAESDAVRWAFEDWYIDFYPRSPCGERQHAQQQHPQYIRHFYPRSPCGERPASGHRRPYQCQFLSTLSLRRATNYSIAQALRL